MPARSRSAQEASQLLAERYGRRPRWSRPVTIAVVALLAAAALGWLLWAAAVQSTPDVSAQIEGFEVRSEHSISVTLAVQRRQRDAVRCALHAEASDHVTVGELTFGLPAGQPGTVSVTRDIRTERAAVTAVLDGCEVTAADGPTAPGDS